MRYEEYRIKAQEEFNALPLFWAFSEKQFEEALKERNASRDDVVGLPNSGGGMFLKKDRDTIISYLNKPDELPELMKNPEFAFDAFYYEMCNHEYGINWQADWDVCSCFGRCTYGEEKDYRDYLKEIGYTDMIESYLKAKKHYFKVALENDWI